MYPGIAQAVNVSEGSTYAAMSPRRAAHAAIPHEKSRAEMYWRFREALDPDGGDNLALPPGNEFVADLCAAHYRVLAGGVIQIETKTVSRNGSAARLTWARRSC
jgi:hypothetical protein